VLGGRPINFAVVVMAAAHAFRRPTSIAMLPASEARARASASVGFGAADRFGKSVDLPSGDIGRQERSRVPIWVYYIKIHGTISYM